MYCAVTDCTDPFDNLVWFPSIALCLSAFYFFPFVFICPPPRCLWLGPSWFGTIPAARFPSLHLSPSLAPIFCIVEVLLRKTRRNSTQGSTHPHTRSAHTHTHTQPETKCWSRHRIYHFYLFIYSSLSVHLSIGFVSWADISLINYLLLLKETTWGARRREWRKQNEER